MTLSIIRKEIVNCRKCDRLVFFREKIAKEKRKIAKSMDKSGIFSTN